MQYLYKLDDILKQYNKLEEAKTFKDLTPIAEYCCIDLDRLVKELTFTHTYEELFEYTYRALKTELHIIEEKTRFILHCFYLDN